MAVRFELVWKGDDGADRSVPIVGTLTVGRGSRNDVVLAEDEVSWEHARVWAEGETLFLDDVGSTNGTFLDERRIRDRVTVPIGSTIRFGTHIEAVVQAREGDAPDMGSGWVLEDLTTGLRRTLQPELVVGDAPDADIRIAGAPRVVFRSVGETVVCQTLGGEPRTLRVGEIVETGGVQLRLLSLRRQTPMRTARPDWGAGHYHVEATLDGRSPNAVITDDAGQQLTVDGETRATLLYVLAKAVIEHRSQGLPPEKQGWMDDMDAVSQVWGRTAPNEVSNRLSVVVYRLRAGLKTAGLSPDFVERSRGRVRIKAARISLG